MNFSKRTKILHLQTELNLACGVTRTISQIIKYSSANFEHYLISLGGDGIKRFNDFGFSPIIFNYNRKSYYQTIKILYSIFKYCRKNSIQIIHCHHRYFDFIIWLVNPFLDIKRITSVQSKVYGKKMFSYKAEKIIACSRSIEKHLLNYYYLKENQISVIFNAVDADYSYNIVGIKRLKSQLGIKLDSIIIGFVGRFDFKEKGIDVLIEAHKKLLKLNYNTHLLMIGDGSNFVNVDIYRNSNPCFVTLLTSKENIFDYYELMDLVVLPSRIEPFGLVAIESGIMQKPFIGSRIDGIAELIDHKKDGLLFTVGDVDDLVNQILEIIKNKKFAESLSQNLYQKVLNNYTAQNIIPQYEKLYSNLLNDD